MSTPWGTGAEEAARRLASELGVKDFVYNPVEVPKGDSTREVSDGMLIVGDRGVILQVKSRDPSSDSNAEKVKRWANKKTREAVRQVQGTRRTLERTRLELRSHRGHELVLEPPHSWPGVVLLDVAPIPDDLRIPSDDPNTLIMTLSDWYSLHHMILSTSGVIDYVERAIREGVTVALGGERLRYSKFARADAIAAGEPGYEPILPIHPLSDSDRLYASIVDEWIDSNIGPTPVGDGPYTADQVRRTIEILDSIPILLRVQVGKAILDRVRDSTRTREPRTGVLAIDAQDRLLFFIDVSDRWNGDEKYLESHLFSYTAVRHEQLQKIFGPGETLMLARIGYDDRAATRTYIRIAGSGGQLNIPPEIRWSINKPYDVLTADGLRDPLSFGEREPCACGSGKEFGQCHLATTE